MFKNIILFLTAIISFALAKDIRMQTLYITNGNIPSVVDTMLNSYGIPFDKLILPLTTITLEESATGTGLYSAIVIEGATTDTYTKQLKEAIETYQKNYGVRAVFLNSEPDSEKGFIKDSEDSTANGINLTSDAEELFSKIQMKSGNDVYFDTPTISVGSNFIVTQHNHINVKIENDKIVQFLKFNNTDLCAGAILSEGKKGEVESMYFFFPFIDSIAAYFMSHLWISWSNHYLINGYRRILFGMQVDDYFANNLVPNTVPERYYRSTVDDMKNLAKWQKDLVNRMPKGSFYKTELAMNGIPIMVTAQHKQFEIRNWEVTPVAQDFVKPMGEGDHRWSGIEDTNWDHQSLLVDPLYAYFSNNDETQKEFFWLTHTFSHQNLNYASKFDVQNEIGLNVKLAGPQYLNVYDKDWFSQNSIVTPEISGLHNGDCLTAFNEYKIYYGVGDTSRADITNLTNPYIPMMTTQQTSLFDGFMVIPRQPTQVYWNIDTVEGTEQYYNTFYNTSITWHDILELESTRAVKLFLQLRHDPYMFHESNLRSADFPEITINGGSGNYGLMQQWIERVVQEITRYVDWPIISKKMDELAGSYIKRMDRIKCNPEYKINMDDNFSIKGITVSASGECEVPFMFIRDAKIDESSIDSVEQIGNDPVTVWVKAKAGSPRTIKFNSDVSWKEENESSFWNDDQTLANENNTIDTPTTIPSLPESNVLGIENSTPEASMNNTIATPITENNTNNTITTPITENNTNNTITTPITENNTNNTSNTIITSPPTTTKTLGNNHNQNNNHQNNNNNNNNNHHNKQNNNNSHHNNHNINYNNNNNSQNNNNNNSYNNHNNNNHNNNNNFGGFFVKKTITSTLNNGQPGPTYTVYTFDWNAWNKALNAMWEKCYQNWHSNLFKNY